MKKGAATDRKDAVAEPTPVPDVIPMPPILPLKREWEGKPVLEGTAGRGWSRGLGQTLQALRDESFASPSAIHLRRSV